MSIMYIQLLLISIVTALACVLPGNFLILRGASLISDALSHAILFGIVVTFLIVHDINSPFIFLGAIISGIATVTFTEILTKSGKLNQDAAIGLTFPFLFSIAVVLINLFANNVHLDTDAILVGELAFAPFYKLYIFGQDCGPIALWNMTIILCMNIACISYFYKELQLTTFDSLYAQTMHYQPRLFHYLLMVLTSITIIQAFHTTGTILVISFIITPAATAYLLTKKLHEMILLSCLLAIIAVLAGFLIAHLLDTSIAGSITLANGFIFFLMMLIKK
ncbi:MAG: metal ABC transporter permease [Candidatus Chromulinivorax sp.]|nr:metal ABC transporter permease [Candidatus Chromulinivorax sp.]